jgi:hypothetical protein
MSQVLQDLRAYDNIETLRRESRYIVNITYVVNRRAVDDVDDTIFKGGRKASLISPFPKLEYGSPKVLAMLLYVSIYIVPPDGGAA